MFKTQLKVVFRAFKKNVSGVDNINSADYESTNKKFEEATLPKFTQENISLESDMI